MKSHIEVGLQHSGYAPVDSVVDSESLAELIEVMGDFDLEGKLLVGGQDTGRVSKNGLLDHRLKPITDKFRVIAVNYLNSNKVKLELTYFQVSRPQDHEDNVPGGAFHLDDNKPNIKFFVYLSDVGPINGPFKVIPKAHGLTRAKVGRFLRWSLFKNRSALYAGPSANLGDTEAVTVLGDSGFCFAVDTTAWHMAEPVIVGERRVFVCSFNMA